MPVQSPQWTEFLSCPVCYKSFNEAHHRPISLGCSHTICRSCLYKLQQYKCPFDHARITKKLDDLPVNFALLQLAGCILPDSVKEENIPPNIDDLTNYSVAVTNIGKLAAFLKPMVTGSDGGHSWLSRPLQKKLVQLINCQLVEEEGCSRISKMARAVGERSVTEIILHHQNPQQLSANLWAAVRARGCQFLGPAMQEEVLKLILLALEDGSALTRKVLVLFVVQRLQAHYPQASKTAIGHVVQLLYRASCFKVQKREEESSLMQLKDDFRSYEGLRREHDAQIVQIAMEAGLRITPDQWSSLLYGDTGHKSHMQSIMDKLQSPQSFTQSVNELMIALQRSGDPGNLSSLRAQLDLLASVDCSPEAPVPNLEETAAVLGALTDVMEGLSQFIQSGIQKRPEPVPVQNTKYKTSMCRDFIQRGTCPRGSGCTFGHSKEEVDRYRAKNRKLQKGAFGVLSGMSLTAKEHQELAKVNRSAQARLSARSIASEEEEQQDCTSYGSPSPVLMDSSSPGITLPGVSVTVPTVKAPVVPVAKGTATKSLQSIYSAPTQIMTPEEYKRRLLKQSTLPSDSVYCGSTVSSYSSTTHSANFSSGHQPVPRMAHQVAPQSERHPGGFAYHHLPADDPCRTAVMMYAGHPYFDQQTGRIPGVEWGFRPESAMSTSMGRSPSQQLAELCHRRVELLSQLNKTKVKVSMTEGTDPVFEPPGTPTSVLQPLSSAGINLTRSVADTMAAIMTTGATTKQESPPVCTLALSEMENYFTWDKSASPEASLVVSTQEDASFMEQVPGEAPILSHSTDDKSSFELNTSPAPVLFEGDEDDEFIPFEHTVVSKYGPISRTCKMKSRQADPLQVTAPQGQFTTPVTAVTPIERPYPITSPVPSHFVPTDHIPDPRGPGVAASLPTAMMKPHLFKMSGAPRMTPFLQQSDGVHTLLAVKDHQWVIILKSPKSPRISMGTGTEMNPGREQEQLNVELAQVTQQIQNLQNVEDERLARELQAVELDIVETQRKISLNDRPSMNRQYSLVSIPRQANNGIETSATGGRNVQEPPAPRQPTVQGSGKSGGTDVKPTLTVAPQVHSRQMPRSSYR